MSDLSKAIFDLWTLAETKVWPEGAPRLVLSDWVPMSVGWAEIVVCPLCEDAIKKRVFWRHDLDAALWRCVQLVAWDFVRRGTPSRNTMMWHVGGAEGWALATPSEWVTEARKTVESFPDKGKP